MSRILGRSKSLRMLRRGGREESQQRDNELSTPQTTLSQVDLRRLKEPSVVRSDARVETPDMLQRPKTSAGSGDRSTLFHKKVTPIPQQQQQETKDFEFTPRSPTKSTTFLYTAELRESNESIIGIALGSPTMASHWDIASPGTDFVSNSHGTITHISSNNQAPKSTSQIQVVRDQQEVSKPKLSRWKSLFRKAGPPPRQKEKEPFYQLDQSAAPMRVDSHHEDDSQEEESSVSSPATYTYNPTIRQSRKLPKGHAQPVLDTRPRALTVTTASKPKPSLPRSASSPKPPKFFSRSPTVPKLVVSSDTQTRSPQNILPKTSSGSKPFLDVDIPEIHMERYSVMFSKFIEQNTSNATTSSLLQRRQAEQLEPLNRLSIKSENTHSKPIQPRSTSPAVPKSPSSHLSLFPSANTSRAPSPRHMQSSVHRTRPLLQRHRAQTAPIAPSNSSNIELGVEGDGTIGLALCTPQPEKGMPRTDAPVTSTPSSQHSFELDDEKLYIEVPQKKETPFRPALPQLNSPDWEMLPKRTPSKASALRSHPATTSPSSAPLEPPVTIATASPITLLRSPSSARSVMHLSPNSRPGVVVSPVDRAGRSATVGVARSVSVTRARSPLLKPESAGLTTTPTISGVGVARSVSVSRANSPLLKPVSAGLTATSAMSSDGRFGDHRALTPTLVELKDRRSQRVQLVEA